jgi:hypothetical protein
MSVAFYTPARMTGKNIFGEKFFVAEDFKDQVYSQLGKNTHQIKIITNTARARRFQIKRFQDFNRYFPCWYRMQLLVPGVDKDFSYVGCNVSSKGTLYGRTYRAISGFTGNQRPSESHAYERVHPIIEELGVKYEDLHFTVQHCRIPSNLKDYGVTLEEIEDCLISHSKAMGYNLVNRS